MILVPLRSWGANWKIIYIAIGETTTELEIISDVETVARNIAEYIGVYITLF